MTGYAYNSPNLYFGAPKEEGRTVVSVSNTKAQITSTTDCNILMVQALLTNTGVVAVGLAPSIVAGSERGYQMQPGQTWFIETRDSNQWYVNGAANDGVIYSLFG